MIRSTVYRLAILFTLHVACGWALPGSVPCAAAAEGAIAGYDDFAALRSRLEKLDTASESVSVRSLATTLGGREVFLVTASRGNPESKPAILVIGSVYAEHLLGSELSVRLAESLANKADPAANGLLDRFTIYVIPRPSPDAAEAFFRKPYHQRELNERPTDDDRDGQTNEDPVEDLNGDGLITRIRVEDPTGDMLPHPLDPRALIKADPAKNERGRFRIYSEGTDNDGDEHLNEDGTGGVALNHNFTFDYPFFEVGAGPHQVSEVESRAVADFAFAHPNIAAVLAFTLEDNLLEPWKGAPEAEKQKIKTGVLPSDAKYFAYLGEQYRSINREKNFPPAETAKGSLLRWAYFHYGRWALGARGWWIPQPPSEKQDDKAKGGAAAVTDKASAPKDQTPKADKDKPEDARGREERSALAWFDEHKIDGFVPWQVLPDHPDFAGKRVEVGGFKPFLRINPPAGELDRLAKLHFDFLGKLVELMPRLELVELKQESIGAGVHRVTAKVLNGGYLPTMSAMGKASGQLQGLQITIELPEGAKLFGGPARLALDPLAQGESAERSWVVVADPKKGGQAKVTVWSPCVGTDTKTLELK